MGVVGQALFSFRQRGEKMRADGYDRGEGGGGLRCGWSEVLPSGTSLGLKGV